MRQQGVPQVQGHCGGTTNTGACNAANSLASAVLSQEARPGRCRFAHSHPGTGGGVPFWLCAVRPSAPLQEVAETPLTCPVCSALAQQHVAMQLQKHLSTLPGCQAGIKQHHEQQHMPCQRLWLCFKDINLHLLLLLLWLRLVAG